MKNLKSLALALLLLFIGCAGSDDSDTSGRAQPRRILTDEEKTRLVTGTIYYTPDYSDLDPGLCADKKNINILNSKNQSESFQLCGKVVNGCRLQGSCIVQINQNKILINYHKKQNNEVYFKTVNTLVCPYGLGNSNDRTMKYKTMCLDPYKSVAADLSIYRLGDVIYMPSLVGMILPDGSVHDGYLIVRDSGGSIKGVGRFDFFTGFQNTAKKTNPFAKLGLGGGVFLSYEHFSFDHPVGLRIRQLQLFPLIRQSTQNP